MYYIYIYLCIYVLYIHIYICIIYIYVYIYILLSSSLSLIIGFADAIRVVSLLGGKKISLGKPITENTLFSAM